MAHTDAAGGKEWVSVSATKIVGFDWKQLQNKESTIHCWTGEAVVDVPEGFRAWKGQPHVEVPPS